MSNPTPARGSFNVATRPSTIAELAEKVTIVKTFDNSRDFEHYLKQAHRHHREWKEFAQIGDIENAFVELGRAATFVLEKLPTHRDYSTFLDENQRHNLVLNGQVMLDNMSALKLRIVDRYDKWLSEHPDQADHERTPSARNQCKPDVVLRQQGVGKEQHWLIEEEATRSRRDESPHNPTPARGSFNVATRPSTIAELAEKVTIVRTLDNSRDFEHYLRQAHRHHRKSKDFAQIGDIENAFVELGRAATFVLEKLPTHRDYSTFLDENQRHCLTLNGQVMLDNMSALKLRIVDRYDKWLSEHPDHADQERTPSAQNQCKPDVSQRQQEVEKEQYRLIEEETTMWKLQRQQREEAERARWNESPLLKTPSSVADSDLCATCGSSVGNVSPLSLDIRDDSGSPIDSINVRLGEPPGLWRNYPTAQAQVYPPIIGPNYPYQLPVPQLCCYACISRGNLMAPSNAYYNSGNVYETTVENVGNVTVNYHYYLNGLMSDPPMEDEVYSENPSDAHDQKHDTVISNTSGWRNTI